MTWVKFVAVTFCIFILTSCSSTPEKQSTVTNVDKTLQGVSLDSSVYKLASGDTVRVDVLGESELSLKALIDPAGVINYPFLGRVQAAGLTVGQLQQRIYTGLSGGFLINPDVRVAVAEYRPVYVSGQVRQAGAYPYSQGLTVDRALTLAGGITTFGSASRIYLQRVGRSEKERQNVGLDALIFPGDTLVVEERLF